MKRFLLALLMTLAYMSASFAQSVSVVILPGGCGTGAYATGTAYLTMDSTGRLCTSNGGSAFVNATGSSNIVASNKAATLDRLVVNTGAGGATVSVYNDTACATNLVGTFDASAAKTIDLGVAMSNGICVKPSTSLNLSVMYH